MAPSPLRIMADSPCRREEEAVNNENNVYLTGLSSRVTEMDIKDYFSKEGRKVWQHAAAAEEVEAEVGNELRQHASAAEEDDANLPLPGLFDMASRFHASISTLDQEGIKKGVMLLKCCDDMIAKLDLFSSNDSREDVISTNNLKYLLVPYYLGEMINKISRDDRIPIIKASAKCLKEFIVGCETLELKRDTRANRRAWVIAEKVSWEIKNSQGVEEEREVALSIISLALCKAFNLLDMLNKEEEMVRAVQKISTKEPMKDSEMRYKGHKKIRDLNITENFCLCCVEMMKLNKMNEVTNLTSEQLDFITEQMIQKSATSFTRIQLKNKLKKLKIIYETYLASQQLLCDKSWENKIKNQRYMELRMIRDGDPPPHLKLLEKMFGCAIKKIKEVNKRQRSTSSMIRSPLEETLCQQHELLEAQLPAVIEKLKLSQQRKLEAIESLKEYEEMIRIKKVSLEEEKVDLVCKHGYINKQIIEFLELKRNDMSRDVPPRRRPPMSKLKQRSSSSRPKRALEQLQEYNTPKRALKDLWSHNVGASITRVQSGASMLHQKRAHELLSPILEFHEPSKKHKDAE